MKEIGVLTIDVSGSREIEDRGAFQAKLKDAIKRVNAEYRPHIISGFSITLGDEFQGALKEPEISLDIFTYFEHLLHPIRIKGGLGIGAVSTPVTKNIREMDGPAFHRSREAVEKAKRSKSRLLAISGKELHDSVVNVILELVGITKDRWTDRQREVTWYISRKKTTIARTAQHFNVTKQNISQILEKAGFKQIKKAEDMVKTILAGRQSGRIDFEK
jgi:hypothetical protein